MKRTSIWLEENESKQLEALAKRMSKEMGTKMVPAALVRMAIKQFLERCGLERESGKKS